MPRNRKSKSTSTTLVTYVPQPTQMSGSGDYKSIFKKMANQIKNNEKQIKKVVTSKPVKKAAKVALSMAARRFLGSGDYETNDAPVCNSLINPTSKFATTEFVNQGRRGVRVTESEFIGDIKSGTLVGGSTVFHNQTFSLNPSNTTTFPWLSTIANSFDQYEPVGVIFRFKSTSSEFNGSSQALGAVILAADYDVNDPPYASKQEMENSDYAISCKSSRSMAMGIECDPKERLTRVLLTGDPDPGSATNFYDFCNVQIASQGMSVADVTLGELWVDYEFVFYKKQQPPLSLIPPTLFSGATFSASENLASGDDLAFGMVNQSQGDLDIGFDGVNFSFGPLVPVGTRFLAVLLYKNTTNVGAIQDLLVDYSASAGITFDPATDFNDPIVSFSIGENANVLLANFTVASVDATLQLANIGGVMIGQRKLIFLTIPATPNFAFD